MTKKNYELIAEVFRRKINGYTEAGNTEAVAALENAVIGLAYEFESYPRFNFSLFVIAATGKAL